MRFYTFLFLLFLLSFSGNCYAQNYLVFRHNNKSFRPYIPGKEISLLVQNGDFKQRIYGAIDSIGDDMFLVDGQKIYLQNVRSIRISRTTYNYKSGGRNLGGAGILLSILLLTNDREMNENLPFYIAAGVLFTSGALMYIVAERNFSLENETNKLMIIKPK
ncbi:MAG: hypothetical protein EOP53_16275 [Sphingobacteriales bacterium]|nr:MAG: hypothetical protein EOP53_16275 [Sphingobacteriales bacterium]